MSKFHPDKDHPNNVKQSVMKTQFPVENIFSASLKSRKHQGISIQLKKL